VLSDADNLIESLERLIAKKRLLKIGVSDSLLSGANRLPGFREEWNQVPLGQIAKFAKGRGLPKSALSLDGEMQCVHYGDLFLNHPAVIRNIQTRCDNFPSAFLSQINDVLMPTSDVTPRGLASASALLQDNVVIGGDVLVIRAPVELLFGPFLAMLIRSSRSDILRLVKGSTVYHLYASDMSGLEIALPQVAEQRAIAEVLSDMDGEIEALERRLAKTRDLKQGMAQELLTGRTRLV
jgi:type I restriction enzyme S subunit